MDKVDFVFPSQSHHILFKTQWEFTMGRGYVRKNKERQVEEVSQFDLIEREMRKCLCQKHFTNQLKF